MIEELVSCNLTQIYGFSGVQSEMINLKTTSDVVKFTGCKPNCISYKYDVIKVAPWTVSHDKEKICRRRFFHFYRFFIHSISVLNIVWLNKYEIIQESEKLVYDELTFISNFGGALGLFIGFSFFSLWDLILMMYTVIKQKFVKQ